MRYWELIEQTSGEKAAKQQQARKRSNDAITAANRQRSDALRRYQERRAKASTDGDTVAAADAQFDYQSARQRADSKATNARNRLAKT